MPLVSIIVPTYNAQRTIGETLQSVFNQTFADFELIIINDGSTDNTLDIVAGFDDPRLKVFSYPNAGVAASRNRGVAHAGGTYLSFIDADDLWTPDKLEAQIRVLERNPQAAVAYSWTNYVDDCGRFIERDERVTYSGNVYAELLVRDFLESGSNALIRRQALIEVGGFDESLMGPEDWDLLIRLAARYPFACVARLGILYRIYSGCSISSNLTRQEKQSLKVINRSFQQAPDFLKPLKQQSLANLYQYLCFKAIEGSLNKEKGWLAARYYWQALKADRSILQHRVDVMSKVCLKIFAAIALPPPLNQKLIAWRRS